MKPTIEILPAAQAHLEQMFQSNTDKLLQIGLSKKGCGGNSYEFSWIEKTQVKNGDEQIILAAGTLVIKADCILYLLGSTLDWKTDPFDSKFIWNNPMAKNTCGCGKSVGF
jgi:iron-sulfur cluster assembly protein